MCGMKNVVILYILKWGKNYANIEYSPKSRKVYEPSSLIGMMS
jgi:hypothetical protein